VTQVVEYLPIKNKALSSIPSTQVGKSPPQVKDTALLYSPDELLGPVSLGRHKLRPERVAERSLAWGLALPGSCQAKSNPGHCGSQIALLYP
jgi:hypothetical protein